MTANTQSAGRFGARYGKKTRENTEAVESQYRGTNTCPACRADALERIAAGIWQCNKCDVKTAGKAYTPPDTTDRSVTREDVTTVLETDTRDEDVSREEDTENTEIADEEEVA